MSLTAWLINWNILTVLCKIIMTVLSFSLNHARTKTVWMEYVHTVTYNITQAVNWFLYSYITPIFWVRILYSEKPPIFPIFSYILNIIPIFFSKLVAVLLKTLFSLFFGRFARILDLINTLTLFQHESHMRKKLLICVIALTLLC